MGKATFIETRRTNIQKTCSKNDETQQQQTASPPRTDAAHDLGNKQSDCDETLLSTRGQSSEAQQQPTASPSPTDAVNAAQDLGNEQSACGETLLHVATRGQSSESQQQPTASPPPTDAVNASQDLGNEQSVCDETLLATRGQSSKAQQQPTASPPPNVAKDLGNEQSVCSETLLATRGQSSEAAQDLGTEQSIRFMFIIDLTCILFMVKKLTNLCSYKWNEITCLIFSGCDYKLMKGKALRKHSLHVKTAASVLLKLFISGIDCK